MKKKQMLMCGEPNYRLQKPQPHKWQFYARDVQILSNAWFQCQRCGNCQSLPLKQKGDDKINFRRTDLRRNAA